MATRNPGESPPFVPPQVHFPGDEGAHPEMLTEWWYGNFALTDPNGREYGAMVTYGNPGGIRILSISDLEAKHFYHEVSMSTPDYARGILDLRWGSDDRWFRTNPDSLSYRLDSYGSEIVLWQVINPDESIESRHLTMMLPDNSVYHTQDFSLERMDTWVSPETGREYGIQWRVREETHNLDLEIKARYPEQEIQMSQALGFTHALWEGRTTALGEFAGKAVSGTGYAELIRPPADVSESVPSA